MHLIGLVKMYKQLALTAREVGEHFLRNAMAWWCHGNDAIVEWNERKFFFNTIWLSGMMGKLPKPLINCINF